MGCKLQSSVVALLMTGLVAAQDRASQRTSPNVLTIAAEAQVRVENAYALYRDHRYDDALHEAREAPRLDPGNTAASGLATLLFLARRSSHSIEPLGEKVSREENTDLGDIVLSTDRPILLRLLHRVESGSSNDDTLGIQVVHDVMLNRIAVIKKQTPVKYSIERQKAGDLTEPEY